jgi:predicted nucleic acid-binding protein
MIKATLDLNVILDFLNKRDSHYHAAQIINLCSNNMIVGYVCAHEITTLAYFLMKNNNDYAKVKCVLRELFDLLITIPVTEEVLKKALDSKITDYKDAVIEISSIKNNIDIIITKNLSDFKHSSIKAIGPAEFLVYYALSKQ